MWIVGLVVGFALGGVFGSWPAALLGAVVGAIGVGLWSTERKNRSGRPVGAGAPEAVIRPVATDLVRELHHRIDLLTVRVGELERAAALRTLTAAAPALPETPVDDPAPAPRAFETADAVMAGRSVADVDPDRRVEPAVVAATETALARTAEPAEAVALAEPSPAVAPAPGPFAATAPPFVRPPPPPAPPPRPWPERLPAPLRRLIFGGNALVKVGVLILFLGLAFLLSYTAERVTVPVEVRYALVSLAGAGLLAFGWFLRSRRRDYALVLQGAGIGIFYLTTLAAMKLHPLLPPTLGFGFLFAVAVLSALLAVLQDAPVLAIVAALEGFAAPVLASTGENHPVGLLTYLLVLDIGIFLVAWFKAWRPLNLIGLVGTFTLAAAAARSSYTDDQYGIYQPFLIVFFVLFAGIGLLFARRTLAEAELDPEATLADRALATLRRVGRVDSSLVFGAPMAAFGLQYLLVRDNAFGAAFSALAFGAFYLALGRFVFTRMPRGLVLLAEAYAIVGVIFATLAIPLGFEGRWTGAAWAIEAAGMYWLGIRQQRPYSRAFAFVLVIGAVVQLLGDIRVVGGGHGALLQGSLIGPLLLAAGVFAVWRLQRRHRLDAGHGWEALAGAPLPWIGIAALVLLPWQTLAPPAAATATALMSVATFAVALRFGLAPLRAIVHALQLLAVLAFVATLQVGDDGHRGVVDAGRYGTLQAALIVASVLATAAASMRLALRAAAARGVAPVWTRAEVAGTLAGVVLLHLAMLLALDFEQAAVVWPVTALIVLRVALRLAHPPLAALAAVLHTAAAAVFGVAFLSTRAFGSRGADLQAFANLDFWTPLALGLSALLAGDACRGQAARANAPGMAIGGRPAPNGWWSRPVVRWWPVAVGLLWSLFAVIGESRRVLFVSGRFDDVPAATVGLLIGASVLASAVAARRDWRELRLSNLAFLPALFLVLAGATTWNGAAATDGYLPSSGFGWIAWPLALGWHLQLLRREDRRPAPSGRARWHIAGLWFFLLLAIRECGFRFGSLGDDSSAWPLFGSMLVPTLLLWVLQTPALLRRWPLDRHRPAYVDLALAPVALLLLAGCWIGNLANAGDAAPLPYLPLLNPLELALALALAAVGLWWRALSPGAAVRVSPTAAMRIAAVTAWALLTGIVLRSCHHYLGIAWDASALYASWPTQAALSLAWAVCGVGAMVFGHARATRPVWIAGAVLIGVVVLKLFFVEFADRGGLFRIVSFIGVGALLLLVGYFAPVPPARRSAEAVPA